jgi:hypothetical protein
LTVSGSIPAKEFTEVFSFESDYGDRKGTEVFFVAGGNGYRIYGESRLDEYADYLPIFNHMIESFQISETASSEVVWEDYSNAEFGFSATLPTDWWVEAADDADKISYQIHAPGHDGCGYLTIAERQGNSLDELADASIASLKGKYATLTIISDQKTEVGGATARETVYVRTDGKKEFKRRAIAMVAGESYYLISYNIHAEVYEFITPTWDMILASFVLRP